MDVCPESSKIYTSSCLPFCSAIRTKKAERMALSCGKITLALRECAGVKVVGQPTAGGLNVPRQLLFGNGDMLMVPERLALGARTRKSPPGMRIQPDILSPNRTVADLVAGRDPQLETARAVLDR